MQTAVVETWCTGATRGVSEVNVAGSEPIQIQRGAGGRGREGERGDPGPERKRTRNEVQCRQAVQCSVLKCMCGGVVE